MQLGMQLGEALSGSGMTDPFRQRLRTPNVNPFEIAAIRFNHEGQL
jgi:hypothetical protein